MKLKDIEGKLKSEQNSQRVPDVLQRAKKAPINRLLDGQTPLKAFDKQTAVRLLWCVMMLLVAAVLAIGAISLIPSGAKDKVALSYINVKVESGGEVKEYGIVVEDAQTVAAFVLEKQNDNALFDNLQKKGYSLDGAINEVYQPKSGDKVSICVLCEEKATDLAAYVADVFSSDGVMVTTLSKSTALSILQQIVGDSSSDHNLLIVKYLEKF